jgi:hypothetical protein
MNRAAIERFFVDTFKGTKAASVAVKTARSGADSAIKTPLSGLASRSGIYVAPSGNAVKHFAS